MSSIIFQPEGPESLPEHADGPAHLPQPPAARVGLLTRVRVCSVFRIRIRIDLSDLIRIPIIIIFSYNN